MKESRASFWAAAAILLAAAVYSVALFLIKPHLDFGAWLLFGFTQIAFLLLAVQVAASCRKSGGLVFDTALALATAVYFLLQFVFGGIICQCFDSLPPVPIVISEVVLLAVYLFLAFAVFGIQEKNAEQDQSDLTAMLWHNMLENDVQDMAEHEIEPAIKKALENLKDDIHCSDIVSLPELTEVENTIEQNISDLRDALTNNDSDPLGKIKYIRQLLEEREKIAAVLKRK